MARIRRRELTPSSLSFLDIMSCGFGAAILLFLIIKHNIDSGATAALAAPDLQSEISLLEEEILVGKNNLVVVKNTIADIDEQLVVAQGLAREIRVEIDELSGHNRELSTESSKSKLEELKTDLIKLEQQKKALEEKLEETGESARAFAGTGDRAYVTGLKIGGKRLLILVDSSASMLDKTIINILRRRNMSDDKKRKAPKWQQTIKVVEWLSAKLPLDSQFQLYSFNTEAAALVPNTEGEWLNVRDQDKLDTAINNLTRLVPSEGTSLANVFEAASKLRPKPDNIYLITDGLPTQGKKPSRQTTVSGKDRLKFFNNALVALPERTPVNVILTPIEGDPYAAIAYWRLARRTQGSFISPSKDWP